MIGLIGRERGHEAMAVLRAKNLAAVLELVLAAGTEGVPISRIVSALGLGFTTVGTALREHRAAGLIERSHTSGAATRWGPPGTAAAYAARVTPKHLRDRASNQRRKAALTEDRLDRPSRQSIVSASEAQPLRPRGPISVFDQ